MKCHRGGSTVKEVRYLLTRARCYYCIVLGKPISALMSCLFSVTMGHTDRVLAMALYYASVLYVHVHTMEEKEHLKNGLKLICQNQVICQPFSESPPTHSRHFPEPVIHHSLGEHWPYIGQWFVRPDISKMSE